MLILNPEYVSSVACGMSKVTLNGRKFAIFFPDHGAATNPTLVSLVKHLKRLGVIVDIYSPYDKHVPQLGIHQYSFPYHYCPRDSYRKAIVRKFRRMLRGEAFYNKGLSKNEYDLIFGVDVIGVIAAQQYSKAKKTPFVYISFEILFRDEITDKYWLNVKNAELSASQEAEFIIIQDEERMQLLCNENDLEPHHMIFLPVSPEEGENLRDSNYLREKYSIPKNNKIVLHAGSFKHWSYAEELVNSIEDCPSNVTLVVNFKSAEENTYIRSLRDKSLSNVVVTEGALDDDEYHRMVASADIGLVLYKPSSISVYSNKNIKHIGLSSGKFSLYAKYGLPIISVGQKTYQSLLNEYKFGIDVSHFDDIYISMQSIMNNYSAFSMESRRLYNEKLKFDLFWPNVKNGILKALDCG